MDARNINDEIIDLWKLFHGEDYTGLSPLLYKEIKERCLLFIGINPGYRIEQFKSCLKGTRYEHFNMDEIHSFINIGKYRDVIIDIYQETRKLPFFHKFDDISKYVGIPCDQIDLFYVRQTNQNTFKQQYIPNNELTDFARKQFAISMKLVAALKPLAIVVSNALASDLIQKYIKNIEYDEKLGIHLIPLGENGLAKYPTFFSGMLNGQHGLDRGSYQRLKWHIKFYIDQSHNR